MKKVWPGSLYIFLFLLLSLPCVWAETLITGRVEKQEQAKALAFENLPRRLKTGEFDKVDPNLIESLHARLQNQTCLPDRQIGFFSTNNSYAVGIYGEYQSLYYRNDGSLYRIEVRTKPVGFSHKEGAAGYPVRAAGYDYPSGRLVGTKVAMSAKEDYTFSPDGKLSSFCLDDACYTPEGQLVTYRKHIFECNYTDAEILEQK